MNQECTVLINSCDKYEDAWYPFFELVKIHWKNCEYPFVLNTETKKYAHDGINLRCINEVENSKLWGKRLKNVLNQIDSKYVILLLEDFFLLDDVKQHEIEKSINWMEKDSEIAAIYFKKIMGYSKVYEKNNDYIVMEEDKRYKLNLQAGLWNKEKLLKIIDDQDSPWDFEESGYKRLVDKNYQFYCSSLGSHYDSNNNVFNYLVARNYGYGIWKGKWLWNNKKLMKKNGIKINKIKMERMSKIQYLLWKAKKKVKSIKKA